jgi:hypothetical protein
MIYFWQYFTWFLLSHMKFGFLYFGNLFSIVWWLASLKAGKNYFLSSYIIFVFICFGCRPDKIWPRPISWPELEGKIWVWVGVFRLGNKNGVNLYPTRKNDGLGSHGSTCFSKDFFFIYYYFFMAFKVYMIMLGIKVLWEFVFEWFGIWQL